MLSLDRDIVAEVFPVEHGLVVTLLGFRWRRRRSFWNGGKSVTTLDSVGRSLFIFGNFSRPVPRLVASLKHENLSFGRAARDELGSKQVERQEGDEICYKNAKVPDLRRRSLVTEERRGDGEVAV